MAGIRDGLRLPFLEAIPLMWLLCLNGSLLQLLSVWARAVCLPVCVPRSLPQGWLPRVMVTCILTPRPWLGCPLGLDSTLAGSGRGSGHPSVPWPVLSFPLPKVCGPEFTSGALKGISQTRGVGKEDRCVRDGKDGRGRKMRGRERQTQKNCPNWALLRRV